MIALIAAILLLSQPADSAAAGDWEGTLQAGATRLRIVFRLVTAADGRMTGTMDSPDQGARGIPLSAVQSEGDSLRIEVGAVGGAYRGLMRDGRILGVWSQSGMRFPLTLRRAAGGEASRRYQDPDGPVPYREEEVSFTSGEIRLAGTLTHPAEGDRPPVVILVSGSGPQDRDGTVFGHRPFLVLADRLTRAGVAVLRCDDRGVGRSGGSLGGVTLEDLAGDLRAAVRFLESRDDVDASRIGLIGHSEGGLIAGMAAADSAACLVLLATPGLRGDSLLLLQSQALARASGMTDGTIASARALNRRIYSRVAAGGDSAAIARDARGIIATWAESLDPAERARLGDIEAFLTGQVRVITSPWFRSFIVHDPAPFLRRVRSPVLALIGGTDLQVPPEENLAAIRRALSGNDRAEVRLLPGLNHLLQTADTGLPAEYGRIEETMAPAALELIVAWVRSTLAPSSGRP